ncbi:polysaccharide pyruvyl transferase family protein [bacterium]|nr:polysaccharide pyruvyl transferase family protein [bacterium]
MRNIVIICCNDVYVSKAIVALKLFDKYNNNYEKAIIGTFFSNKTKKICEKFNIILKEINLNQDFYDLDKRKQGLKYPIECFYHFYAYKLFPEYDFIIQIEPDIYTNKKIDIDFKSIEYISGGYQEKHTIKDFSVLFNNYIKSYNIIGDFKCHRILGGVKIYNIKNLKKINFYEKIVEIYEKSLKIKEPRNGDDSLMVLYQLLNPSHVYLLPQKFHVIFSEPFNNSDYTDISFFHFGGSTEKYWNVKNYNTLNNVQKYFYDNMIEYVYNTFSLEFIREHLPEIYVDISNIIIPFYYYSTDDNFGDLITPYFLNKFCEKNTFKFDFSNKIPKIISCGSIMRLCNESTIVWGSGIRDIDQDINKGIIKSVRGPLTRKRLLEIGCYCPPVYGDPGLLLPLYYYPAVEKKYKIGIIPHYIHYDVVFKMYDGKEGIKVIKLINKDIEPVINDILSCEKTISSSLHGLIVSDAYGIPNKWVKFNNDINGDDTKYYDYFNSVERIDKKYINCLNYKKIPENTYEIIEKVNIKYDINYVQEKFFMDKNGIKPYTKFLYSRLISSSFYKNIPSVKATVHKTRSFNRMRKK